MVKLITATLIAIGIYMIYKGSTEILDPLIISQPVFWLIVGLSFVFFAGPNTFKGKLKSLGIK